MNLDAAYADFISDRETSCSDRTLEYYRDNVMAFISYLEDVLSRPACQINVADITRDMFRDYVKFLRKRPKNPNHPFITSGSRLSAVSIQTYARAIKAFAHFCQDNEYCDDFTYKIRIPKAVPEDIIPLDRAEVSMIDHQFSCDTELGLRNWIIVHLMLDCGLRSSEVIGLRISDILFSKQIICIHHAKGDKSRIVILPDAVKSNISHYVSAYRARASAAPLLVSMKSEPINKNVIKNLFRRLKLQTGIDRLHPHLLRHTFATSYIMGGGNLEMLRILLGHSDYNTTRMYLHLAQQSQLLRFDIYRLDPLFFKTYQTP